MRWEDWLENWPRKRHFHYISREKTLFLKFMLLPEEVESQRFANMDSTSTTPLLEVDSNHDLEEISFQPVSAPSRQHQIIITCPHQSITSDQPESIIFRKLQSNTPFPLGLQHHSFPSSSSENLTCSNNQNENLLSDCSYLTSFSHLETPIHSSIIFSGM